VRRDAQQRVADNSAVTETTTLPQLPGYRVLSRTATRDCPVALHQRGRHYAITSCNHVLMTNDDTGSERMLGRLTGVLLRGVRQPRILVGGLGMGFTLRALLDRMPRHARIVVAELLPAVARWNRHQIGHLSARPIDDPRVRLRVADVARLVRGRPVWNAIVLDVDNGPEWMVQRQNGALYSPAGLIRLTRSLRPGGILAFWSASRHRRFELRLSSMGLRWRRYRAVSRGGHPTGPVLYIVQPTGCGCRAARARRRTTPRRF
jgi:spermidine synthase